MADLKTQFVFIDTSIFESGNFFEGKKIQKVFGLANENAIQIVLPDLTYRELLNRMKKGLKKAENYLNQKRKEIDSHSKLLRNIGPYKTSFLVPRVKVEADLQEFKNVLDGFFAHGKVHLLESKDLPCGPVFERYFSEQPPFQGNKEDKKHEFLDAFAIATVENWCSATGQSCYALSSDSDIKEYDSKYLIPIDNVAEFIDLVLRAQAKQLQQEFISTVDRIIKEKHFELQELLNKKLQDALYDAALNIGTHPMYELEEVDDWNVKNIELLGHSILQLDDRGAKVDIIVRFDFHVKADVLDYSSAMYDREDSRWWGEEKDEIEIDDSMIVTVKTTVVHHPLHGKQFEEIIIENIENGQGLALGGYF